MHLHEKMANKFFLPHKTQKIPYFTDNLAFALAVATALFLAIVMVQLKRAVGITLNLLPKKVTFYIGELHIFMCFL